MDHPPGMRRDPAQWTSVDVQGHGGREEFVMTTFTVWKFDDPEGAKQAYGVLRDAESDQLVKVVDHAIVTWPQGADRPDTDLSHDEKKRGGVWGGFLGVLIGMLFFIPVFGALAGAAIGATVKAMDGTGITKKDVERIRDEVTPGTSALFMVTENADFDRLGERFHGMKWQLVSTNLTDVERKVLVDTFGG
jgi:uncharacterized membrane protein